MFAIKRILFSNPKILGHLSVATTILLILMLAKGLAELSWNLLLPPSLSIPSGADIRTSLPVAVATHEDPDYTTVANWHLFGEAPKAQPTPAPRPVQAPETKLNLTLVGTFFSEDSPAALALIATGNNANVSSYRVGATIGDARLQQVLPDRIILSRDGRLETLRLPTQKALESLGAQSQSPEVPSNEAANADAAGAGDGAGDTVDARALAQQLRQRIAAEPQTLQDIVQARPYIKNGEFAGFRLLPGRDNRFFQQLGLESGDVVTQVNGARLDDPQRSLEVLRDLLDADRVDVQVLRQGVEIPYTFVLDNSQ